MISFPLYLTLIPYGIFLLAYAIFSTVILYNAVNYSANSLVSFAVTFLFLGATVMIAYATYTLLIPLDWTTSVIMPIPNFWPSTISL